jgi:RNA polymerase sigma-70 factor (ECF subfamily)
MSPIESAEHALASRTAAEVAAPLDFDAIYREHFGFVWRAAIHLGIEEAFLDDAVQETFVVVHRRLEDFEGRSSVKTWIYGIIRRVAADHRRTLRRKPPGSDDARVRPGSAAQGPLGRGPDASVEQAEQVLLLRRLLAGLDDEKREVFILAELEEMTSLEIGEALGVNPNTISSRLRAARRDFEEALGRAISVEHDAATGVTGPGRSR